MTMPSNSTEAPSITPDIEKTLIEIDCLWRDNLLESVSGRRGDVVNATLDVVNEVLVKRQAILDAFAYLTRERDELFAGRMRDAVEAGRTINALRAEVSRLSIQIDKLQIRCNEGHAAHAASFGALRQIATLLDGDWDVDDYQDIVKAVSRLSRKTAAMKETALTEYELDHILNERTNGCRNHCPTCSDILSHLRTERLTPEEAKALMTLIGDPAGACSPRDREPFIRLYAKLRSLASTGARNE